MKLKSRIASVKDNYDFVIIDSSPAMNEELLSTIMASDNLFVVLDLQALPRLDFAHLAEH